MVGNSTVDDLSQHGDWVEFIGIAAEDKDPDSHTLKVYPPEMLPFAQGALSSDAVSSTFPIDDEFTIQKQYTVTATNVITAQWENTTNRRFPPDVKKGEQVRLRNYANLDTYYWDSWGRDDDLRRQERYRLDVAATPNMKEEHTNDNTYFVELDSRPGTKKVEISTSQTDGEEFRYLLLFDIETSTVVLQDNGGNTIKLESKTPRIVLVNNKGTTVDLNKEDATISAPRDLKLIGNRQIVLETPIMTNQNKSGTGVTAFNGKGLVLNFDNVKVNASTIGLQGAVVADTVVAKTVQAEGFSSGTMGGNYPSPSTDPASGTGNNPSASPNTGSGGVGNRHCAAHEEVKQALDYVADLFDILNTQFGLGLETNPIRQLAAETIMNKNRGE